MEALEAVDDMGAKGWMPRMVLWMVLARMDSGFWTFLGNQTLLGQLGGRFFLAVQFILATNQARPSSAMDAVDVDAMVGVDGMPLTPWMLCHCWCSGWSWLGSWMFGRWPADARTSFLDKFQN